MKRASRARAVRLVIGAMTGTSVDGIDLALLEIRGVGLAIRAKLLRGRSASLGPLAPPLRAAAAQQPRTAREFASLAHSLGELHAREAAALAAGDAIDLIAVHGQTVAHAPPRSWQLVNLSPIAASLGCRIIGDLRQADLAAGGQGAPLTPLADWILYRAKTPRVVVNLGGFANATALPGGAARARAIDRIRGADLCVCNQLLDAAARRVLGRPFDRNGAAARRGRADRGATDELVKRLERQRLARRSLGTGDELGRWIDRAAANLAARDLLASAVSAIGRVIANGIRELATGRAEVIVAGGGARNVALREAISNALGAPVVLSDDLGIPATLREAACWAVLGALADDGAAISLPQVTGRGAPLVRDGVVVEPRRPRTSPRTRNGSTQTGGKRRRTKAGAIAIPARNRLPRNTI